MALGTTPKADISPQPHQRLSKCQFTFKSVLLVPGCNLLPEINLLGTCISQPIMRSTSLLLSLSIENTSTILCRMTLTGSINHYIDTLVETY